MPSEPRPRVLYVEDDEDARDMLSARLGYSQIEATTVSTAAQALAMILAERFDLYVLDTSLPDLDGFDLCRQMRLTDATTPIVFFSGNAYAADVVKGLAAGANAYLVKPDVDGVVGSITSFVFPLQLAAA